MAGIAGAEPVVNCDQSFVSRSSFSCLSVSTDNETGRCAGVETAVHEPSTHASKTGKGFDASTRVLITFINRQPPFVPLIDTNLTHFGVRSIDRVTLLDDSV